MKASFVATLFTAFSLISFHLWAQTSKKDTFIHKPGAKHLFMDVHQLEPNTTLNTGNTKGELTRENLEKI